MREHEALLWLVLSTVENHTLEHYRASAPALASPEKAAAVREILDRIPEGTSLSKTPLEAALKTLLESAAGDGSKRDVLWIQGVVLEQLGATIYQALQENDRLDAPGAAVAASAERSSTRSLEQAARALCVDEPEASERFYAFTSRTNRVFHDLDTLGVALDEAFAGPLDLRFADLMGDFVADLLPICTGTLGFDRRRVMVHLSSALM